MSRVKNAIVGRVAQAFAWLKSLAPLRIMVGLLNGTTTSVNNKPHHFVQRSGFARDVLSVAIGAFVGAVLGVGGAIAGAVVGYAWAAYEAQRVIADELRAAPLTAITDERPASADIRDALCILELTGMRIVDHVDDRSLIIVPLKDWSDATRRLWRALRLLEERPPTRNHSTRDRVEENTTARDREALKLLATRDA